MGILDQIEKTYYYKECFSLESLEAAILDDFLGFPSSNFIWYGINTVIYSGENLKELHKNKSNALKARALLTEIQGFKPKIKYERRKERNY